MGRHHKFNFSRNASNRKCYSRRRQARYHSNHLTNSLEASRSSTADNGNQDVDKNEIPGFYFDSERQTYFRVTQENYKYFKGKIQKACLTKTEKRKRLSLQCKTNNSLASQIVYREYQTVPAVRFQINVLNTRLKMMKAVHHSRLTTVDYVPENCQTMIGNPVCGSIVGAWTTPVGTVIYNFRVRGPHDRDVEYQEEPSVVNVYYNQIMTDMCIAKVREGLEFVLYVGNPSRPRPERVDNRSTMHLYPIRRLCNLTSPENRFILDSMTLNLEQSNSVLWSCAWNTSMQRMAFGSEGQAKLISLQENANHVETKLPVTKENVFSLEFNTPGSVLYCGTNKGNLKCFDLRSAKLASNIRLSRGLSSLKLLSSEEHVIASCYDHKLLQVDLRMRKVLVEYSGHNNEHLKMPVSVSEKNGFLCSAGQDRFTRIWSLKHGTLLSSIPPTTDTLCSPFAWFSEEWNFGSFPETAVVINEGAELTIYKT